MEIDTQALSRRGIMAGGAAIGGGALLGAGSALTAQAATGPTDGPTTKDGKIRPFSDPGGARIGSPLIGGYTYIHRSFMDFDTLDLSTRSWSTAGVYGNPGPTETIATLDLPPGAVVRDIEWYFYATANATLGAWLWTTGSASFVPISLLNVTAGAATLRAQRAVVASASNGPYANGARLMLDLFTSPNVRINGARVGYSAYPSGTVMLPTPVRAYDSRSGAKIGNGQTRIHSLASYIPAGATSAIVNLTATSGEKSGGLAIYNTGSSLPSGSLVYYNGGTTESNEVHVKLPSDRKVKVTMRGVSGCKVHYFIDVLGYTA